MTGDLTYTSHHQSRSCIHAADHPHACLVHLMHRKRTDVRLSTKEMHEKIEAWRYSNAQLDIHAIELPSAVLLLLYVVLNQ